MATDHDADQDEPDSGDQPVETVIDQGTRHVDGRDHQRYPRFNAAQLDKLRRFGTIEHWKAGDVMFNTGDPGLGMRVVIKGMARLMRRDGLGHSHLIADLGEGQFLGETNQLSGKPALADGIALTDVEALLIAPDRVRALLVAEAQLGEEIVRAMILRRMGLVQKGSGPVLIGAANHPQLVALQGLLQRLSHPHSVLDVDSDPDARSLLERIDSWKGELPIVMLTDGTVMLNPDEGELATRLGLLIAIDPARTYDIAVVGAGPAGLATAVYAASEGLSVAVFDARGPGGQASASARIENYLGFPTGISGRALAGRAFVQAIKFGAEIAVPARVAALDCTHSPIRLELSDGQRVSSHAVVIATGAAYRRPVIEGLDQLDGRGVYYWASSIEAKLCADTEVALVGGGNSAGQAIVFLSSTVRHVHVVIRADGLGHSMSRYLIDRIEALPNVTLHTNTVVASVTGDEGGLTGIVCKGPRGEQTFATRHLFLFTGADPNTGWLRGCNVAVDEKGFVKTGLDAGAHAGAACTPLQTSVPGVFAIGDVRSSSAKRVAAAVGDGAAAVAEIHAYLANVRAMGQGRG